MANHTTGTTSSGNQEEWTEDGQEYNPLYFDCEVALRQYTMEADAYGDIEFWFYRSYEIYDAEDGWPVVYSDTNGKPSQLLVSLTKMRTGLLTGEIGHWAHCTLHMTRPLRRNEKVWIGIWSIFYTTTFDILDKLRPAATDYIWTYALDTYRDDLEDPPPAQAPSEWIKSDWRPLALLPHYFVYSDESPYRDYVCTVSDTIGMTALFGRKYRSFLKQVTANLHATGTAGMHGWIRRYAADAFTLTDSTTKSKGLRMALAAFVHAAESFMKRLRMVKEVQDFVDATESRENWRRLIKRASSVVDADDEPGTWRTLLLKKATVAFVFAEFTIMKTLNCLIHEALALAGRIRAGRVIARFVDTAVTFWERLVRRRFTNRLGMEFWSPVTTELTLKSIIQEDRT